jgi:predicted TIM-barrel fold metal-dependent hydrolase
MEMRPAGFVSPVNPERDRAGGGIIDCDVHPLVTGGFGTLFPYLDRNWQKRLEPRRNYDTFGTPFLGMPPHFLSTGSNRVDATPPTGGPPGSDPKFMAKDLLDRNGIDIGVLLPFQPARLDSWKDADEAATLAAAYNSYFVDHWLEVDRRYRLAIVVAPQDPGLAATEIRRLAGTPGIVGVWLPPIDYNIGYRYYNPIYEAAQEAGLPIMLHVTASPHQSARPGRSTIAEFYAAIGAIGQNELCSLVFEGALSRFPQLKVVFVEYGWTWVPSMLWRLDQTWKSARPSVPYIDRPPSEYILERVRFTSEPAVEVPNDEYERQILEMMRADRTLLFSTDYPHWDSDTPTTVFNRIDPDLRHRIQWANAAETFGERLLAGIPARV